MQWLIYTSSRKGDIGFNKRYTIVLYYYTKNIYKIKKCDDKGIPMLKPIIVLNDKSSSHLFISLHECADRHAMKMNIAQPLILYEYFFASTFTL